MYLIHFHGDLLKHFSFHCNRSEICISRENFFNNFANETTSAKPYCITILNHTTMHHHFVLLYDDDSLTKFKIQKPSPSQKKDFLRMFTCFFSEKKTSTWTKSSGKLSSSLIFLCGLKVKAKRLQHRRERSRGFFCFVLFSTLLNSK